MSCKQRLKSGYTLTRFEFSWKMIPESWSHDRKRPITPVRSMSLKTILCKTGSQCSSFKIGVI